MHKLAVVIMAAVVLALSVSGVSGAPPAQAPVAPDAPAGWQTIMSEDFEGAWPGSGWTVTDLSNDGFERYWGKEDFEPASVTYPDWPGNWSAWPASGGAQAVDPAVQPYPDSMSTQMIYGPFDLSDALAAEIRFWVWLETEVYEERDYLSVDLSSDGTNFGFGGFWEGTLDWTEVPIDLASYMGDPTVWVRWEFGSDLSVGLGGAFVDNITISKLPLAAPAVTISRSGSNVTLDWTADANATGYEVWWGINDPYFTPGATCPGTNCAVVAAPPYLHTNPVSTANNYTYVVRAVKGNSRSAFSNRTGEFDYTLVH